MIDYSQLKSLHAALATVSVVWFIWRAVPVLMRDRWPTGALHRVGPHVVDTLLLVSGVALAFMASWNPATQGWLALKLVLLVAYIGLAMMALKPRFPRPVRVALFADALLVFLWMYATALVKSPWGPLRWLGWV